MRLSLKNKSATSRFPIIHHFDQDLISLYNYMWSMITNEWKSYKSGSKYNFIDHPEMDILNIIDISFSSFALLYSNSFFQASDVLDIFIEKQEPNGAIRCSYNKKTGKPVPQRRNSKGLAPPILIWAEHNYFNKTDNKRRLKKVLPKLDAYLTWIESLCIKKNDLFICPINAMHTPNTPRKKTTYLIDFNSQMAMAYNYMAQLATAINNRNYMFKYTKAYYKLKSVINDKFWNEDDGFYYDLDEHMKPIKIKTISSFWTLLAQIPNNTQVNKLISYLTDPNHFGTNNPFPTLSVSEKKFSEKELGFRGAVYPLYTFMIIKGLELYDRFELARECTFKHLYSILEVWLLHKNGKEVGAVWEMYHPTQLDIMKSINTHVPVRKNYLSTTSVSVITLFIEIAIGFDICLPKKIIKWVIPLMEPMGIESIQFKKNVISTIMQKTNRGWGIRHSSEKLYYFCMDVQELNTRKTIPIPAGKCFFLLEKL